MTKEPSKDFRQALKDVLDKYAVEQIDLVAFGNPPTHTLDEATTRIIALCKEMLVRAEFEPDCYEPENCSCAEKFRQHLLKQLGGGK